MTYSDMPVIIPLLATAYLFTIYLLLALAQRTAKGTSYAANSWGRAVNTEDMRLPHSSSRREASPASSTGIDGLVRF